MPGGWTPTKNIFWIDDFIDVIERKLPFCSGDVKAGAQKQFDKIWQKIKRNGGGQGALEDLKFWHRKNKRANGSAHFQLISKWIDLLNEFGDLQYRVDQAGGPDQLNPYTLRKDLDRKAFEHLPVDDPACCRFLMSVGAGFTVLDRNVAIRQDDIDFLRAVSNRSEYFVGVRALAARYHGELLMHTGDIPKAAQPFQKCITICRAATDNDKAIVIFDTRIARTGAAVPKNAGEFLSQQVQCAQEHLGGCRGESGEVLTEAQRAAQGRQTRTLQVAGPEANGETFLADQQFAGSLDSVAIAEKYGPAEQCGHCEKPWEEMPQHLRCQKCKRQYYCNADCQAAHWKAGHKRICKHREADELMKGDKCRIRGYNNKNRKFNGQCCTVIGRSLDSEKSDMWEVVFGVWEDDVFHEGVPGVPVKDVSRDHLSLMVPKH